MELLDVKDILPILKVNKDTFYTWIKRDNLPEGLIVKIGHTTKIRKYVLDKWLMGEL